MEKSREKIHIVTASYQGEKYISTQMDSLLKSDYQNFLVHVFDDGSTDKTISIVKAYAEKYPGKIILHENKKNQGVTLNFLNGLRQTADAYEDSGYFMFCDQDDYWMDAKMRIFMKEMKRLEGRYGKGRPLLVFSDAFVFRAGHRKRFPSYHKSQRLDVSKIDPAHLLMENKCSGCMMMVNRALADKIQKMPSHARYHDWWLALAASFFGHIHYIAAPYIFYRQHGGNIIGNQSRTAYIMDRLSHLAAQKQALRKLELQAEEFLKLYEAELPAEKISILKQFALLHKESWLKRRYIVFRHGYLKSTLLRNIGIFLLI